MSEIKVENKEVVVPGQVLATGMDYLPGNNTYRQDDNILALKVGIVNVDGRAIKILPLAGPYLPKKNDTIIARVEDITMNGWRMDIFTAYSAFLPIKDASNDYIQKGSDLRKILAIGDYAAVKITDVTSQMLIDLNMKGPGLRRLSGGRTFKVTPSKVPRIIGKDGSMISMVKDATGCSILVGQNGLVWIRGQEPQHEILATKAIEKIEAEAHISGLTDRVKEYLNANKPEDVPVNEEKAEKKVKTEKAAQGEQ